MEKALKRERQLKSFLFWLCLLTGFGVFTLETCLPKYYQNQKRFEKIEAIKAENQALEEKISHTMADHHAADALVLVIADMADPIERAAAMSTIRDLQRCAGKEWSAFSRHWGTYDQMVVRVVAVLAMPKRSDPAWLEVQADLEKLEGEQLDANHKDRLVTRCYLLAPEHATGILDIPLLRALASSFVDRLALSYLGDEAERHAELWGMRIGGEQLFASLNFVSLDLPHQDYVCEAVSVAIEEVIQAMLADPGVDVGADEMLEDWRAAMRTHGSLVPVGDGEEPAAAEEFRDAIAGVVNELDALRHNGGDLRWLPQVALWDDREEITRAYDLGWLKRLRDFGDFTRNQSHQERLRLMFSQRMRSSRGTVRRLEADLDSKLDTWVAAGASSFPGARRLRLLQDEVLPCAIASVETAERECNVADRARLPSYSSLGAKLRDFAAVAAERVPVATSDTLIPKFGLLGGYVAAVGAMGLFTMLHGTVTARLNAMVFAALIGAGVALGGLLFRTWMSHKRIEAFTSLRLDGARPTSLPGSTERSRMYRGLHALSWIMDKLSAGKDSKDKGQFQRELESYVENLRTFFTDQVTAYERGALLAASRRSLARMAADLKGLEGFIARLIEASRVARLERDAAESRVLGWQKTEISHLAKEQVKFARQRILSEVLRTIGWHEDWRKACHDVTSEELGEAIHRVTVDLVLKDALHSEVLKAFRADVRGAVDLAVEKTDVLLAFNAVREVTSYARRLRGEVRHGVKLAFLVDEIRDASRGHDLLIAEDRDLGEYELQYWSVVVGLSAREVFDSDSLEGSYVRRRAA